MEKSDSFEFQGDDRALSWLADMQPASAAALKPEFLYRAGYEAARRQLLNKLRRCALIGSAALLLVALGAASFVYELGSKHGQVLAARQLHADDGGPPREPRAGVLGEASVHKDSDDAATNQAQAEPTTERATADRPAHAALEADQDLASSAADQTPAISRWWQSQLRQCFAGTATDRDRYPRRLDLDRTGSEGDELVESLLEERRAVSLVSKSSPLKSLGPMPNIKEDPADSPAMRLPGSLLPLRGSQIQTLMNELF